MRIGVFGHYGNRNLGDEAITEAVVTSVQRLAGATEVRLYSIDPSDSAARHQLDAYPIRRGPAPVIAGEAGKLSTRVSSSVSGLNQANASADESALRSYLKRSNLLKRLVGGARTVISAPGRFFGECKFLAQSFRSLKTLDLMIVAGSNQYLDNFGGVMGFPYTLLKWGLLCRLRGIRVIHMSVGAGPLKHPASRTIVRAAIRLSDFHSYRDEASRRLIEGSDARLGGLVYPDLACNLEFPEIDIDFSAEIPTVAINPMPVYGDYWFVKDPDRYRRYLTTLSQLILHLDRRACRTILFPTQYRDMDAIRDLVAILESREPSIVSRLKIEDALETQDVMRIIQSAHVVVPTRFHGTVLGILAKRLVIGVCYQAKAFSAMAAAGQKDYAFMLDDMTSEDLTGAFDRLWEDRATLLEAIRRRSDDVRGEIDEQYGKVLSRVRMSTASASA